MRNSARGALGGAIVWAVLATAMPAFGAADDAAAPGPRHFGDAGAVRAAEPAARCHASVNGCVRACNDHTGRCRATGAAYVAPGPTVYPTHMICDANGDHCRYGATDKTAP